MIRQPLRPQARVNPIAPMQRMRPLPQQPNMLPQGYQPSFGGGMNQQANMNFNQAPANPGQAPFNMQPDSAQWRNFGPTQNAQGQMQQAQVMQYDSANAMPGYQNAANYQGPMGNSYQDIQAMQGASKDWAPSRPQVSGAPMGQAQLPAGVSRNSRQGIEMRRQARDFRNSQGKINAGPQQGPQGLLSAPPNVRNY